MPGLKELQDECKALGVPSSLIRRHMNDADQLQSLIESFNKGKAHVKEVKKMARPVARAKAKAKKISRRPAARKATPVAAPKKRGRPVGSKNKAKPQVRAPRTVARKPTRKPAARKPVQARKPRVNSNEAGRHEVGRINFSKTDGWNPRDGSITSDIFAALKQSKGDREKTFKLLLSWAAMNEWVPRTKPNGQKRTKDEQEAMLRYRINRTLWDFAIQTGQHDKSENRIEYGQGTKNGKAKPKAGRPRTKPKPAPKPAARQAPKRKPKPAPKATATRKATTKRSTRQSSRRPARARR